MGYNCTLSSGIGCDVLFFVDVFYGVQTLQQMRIRFKASSVIGDFIPKNIPKESFETFYSMFFKELCMNGKHLIEDFAG